MAGLYDLEASSKRMARADRSLREQKRLVADARDPFALARAEADLVEIEDLYAIIARTHVLLTTTYEQLERIEADARMEQAQGNPRYS